jgi:predicted nucleic acid-binding protein
VAVFVLDTSAVSAQLREEAGHLVLEELLERARSDEQTVILMPFIVLMETEYTAMRIDSLERVEALLAGINDWPVQVIESNVVWRREAAQVKSRGRISVADAWVAALALINDAELVHKDPEFDAVPGLKALRLPYDREMAGGDA